MSVQSPGQLRNHLQVSMHGHNHHQQPLNRLMPAMLTWLRSVANHQPRLFNDLLPNQAVPGIFLSVMMMMTSWNPCRGDLSPRNSASMQV